MVVNMTGIKTRRQRYLNQFQGIEKLKNSLPDASQKCLGMKDNTVLKTL
jgi:hypothetical protein